MRAARLEGFLERHACRSASAARRSRRSRPARSRRSRRCSERSSTRKRSVKNSGVQPAGAQPPSRARRASCPSPTQTSANRSPPMPVSFCEVTSSTAPAATAASMAFRPAAGCRGRPARPADRSWRRCRGARALPTGPAPASLARASPARLMVAAGDGLSVEGMPNGVGDCAASPSTADTPIAPTIPTLNSRHAALLFLWKTCTEPRKHEKIVCFLFSLFVDFVFPCAFSSCSPLRTVLEVRLKPDTTTTDSRLPTPDYRLPTTDSRLLTLDS